MLSAKRITMTTKRLSTKRRRTKVWKRTRTQRKPKRLKRVNPKRKVPPQNKVSACAFKNIFVLEVYATHCNGSQLQIFFLFYALGTPVLPDAEMPPPSIIIHDYHQQGLLCASQCQFASLCSCISLCQYVFVC